MEPTVPTHVPDLPDAAPTTPDGAVRLPLHAALETLDAWSQFRDADSVQPVREALERLVGAHGATGAFVSVDAPHLPPLDIGVGDLAHLTSPPPPETARERPMEAGGRFLGRVWVTGDGAGRELVRALGLAVDATSSRAGVRVGTARLAALDAAVRGISGVLSVDRVLQLIVDQVRSLVDGRYAALGTVDDQGVIERFITSGISREERARIGDLPRGRGLLGLIVRENRSFRIDEIAHHPNSAGFPPHHPAMHSFLGVPVQVRGRSVGNLYLTNKRGETPFTEEDQRLVETFSLHAGIAIENARLHEAVERMAVVHERERIGRDLHDGIIQRLYAVGLSLEDVPELMREDAELAAGRVDHAIDSINLTIGDIRTFIFGLRQTDDEPTGLVGGLAALADEVRLNTVMDVDVDLPEAALDVDARRSAELVAVAREAMSNVVRHADATRVTLTLRSTGAELELSVVDNGVGFEPDAERVAAHQGLRNMAARAEALGGRLTLTSERNEGTRLTVRVPRVEDDDDD